MSGVVIPRGWIQAEIGELCDLINGRAFKPTEWSDEGLPIIRIQNLNNPNAPFNHFDGELADKHRIQYGDLLFAWSGTPGTSFGAHVWRGNEAALNQHIFKVGFDESRIDKRFLRYAINQTLDELVAGAHGGVGLRHVTKGKFEKTRVAFPAFGEQIAIADKLDELLTQVSNLKARLDAIPAILKRFRQSVLAAAVSGKITEDWRGKCELEGWCDSTLIDVIREKPRNGWSPRAVDYETDLKNLTLSAVTQGYFVDGKFKYVNGDVGRDSHLWVRYGDILIQRANTIEYVGVSAIYKGEDCKYIYPDLMMKVTPIVKVVGEYLHYVLLTKKVRRYFRDNATGTSGNMPKINQKVVSAAPIPLPPLEEQKEIVRRVDQLFAFADQTEQQVANAQARVDKLTQSILAKAFRGELSAEWRAANPELISGEHSAEALLERIKAEKARQAPTKTRRGGRTPVADLPADAAAGGLPTTARTGR